MRMQDQHVPPESAADHASLVRSQGRGRRRCRLYALGFRRRRGGSLRTWRIKRHLRAHYVHPGMELGCPDGQPPTCLQRRQSLLALVLCQCRFPGIEINPANTVVLEHDRYRSRLRCLDMFPECLQDFCVYHGLPLFIGGNASVMPWCKPTVPSSTSGLQV